ncbi:MAG: PAS domain S-box protein, partial [Myxococcota bacterium]
LLGEVTREEDALLQTRQRALAIEQGHLLQRLGGGLLCIALAIAGMVLLLLRSSRMASAREAQFRSMFEAASEGIWLLDADGRVTMANAAMSTLLGYPTEELIGRVYWEHFLFPEDVAFARELFHRRQQGSSEATDLRFRHRSGKPVWTLLSARSIEGPGGTYAGALDFFTDITERHLAEERVHFLSAVGTRLLATLTPPEDLARATTDALRQFLDVDRCAFEELQGDRLVTLGVSVRAGDPGPTERPLAALGRAREDVLAGRRVVVEDATRAPIEDTSRRARAWVLLPRHRPGDGVSLISVESANARPWAPGDLELLTSIADRASLAVDNARLQRDLARRFMELDAIYGQASVGLAFIRRDRRFVRVNTALARIHGRTPEECEHRLVEEVTPALWPQLAPA